MKIGCFARNRNKPNGIPTYKSYLFGFCVNFKNSKRIIFKKKTKKLDTSEIKKIQIPKRDASFIFNDLIYTIYLLHTKMLNLC